MAHAIGLVVVTEGVETESQLALLRELGCDEVQGFLLGRPEGADIAMGKILRGSSRRRAVPGCCLLIALAILTSQVDVIAAAKSTSPRCAEQGGRSRRPSRRRTPSTPGRCPTSAGTGSPATPWCCRTACTSGAWSPTSAVTAARDVLAGRLPLDVLRGRSCLPMAAQCGRDRALPPPRRDGDGRGPRAGRAPRRRPHDGRPGASPVTPGGSWCGPRPATTSCSPAGRPAPSPTPATRSVTIVTR